MHRSAQSDDDARHIVRVVSWPARLRGMSDENQAQERSSVVVYQYGRGLRWFLLLGSAAFIAALVWLLFSDRPSRSDSLGGWFVSIVILGGSILFFGLGMHLNLLPRLSTREP